MCRVCGSLFMPKLSFDVELSPVRYYLELGTVYFNLRLRVPPRVYLDPVQPDETSIHFHLSNTWQDINEERTFTTAEADEALDL
ncbi:hypothetical protein PanWU01x14_360320 [Parasponia andersonii]|uniref:Uncharacterized protein n=1 Tax=Parasponia andersonii TaxID=3476 RepID=A0A2P5A7Q6_PARAD|nr:hypothetical protein PanWU01x14_360320 [Parasponia andersonii]